MLLCCFVSPCYFLRDPPRPKNGRPEELKIEWVGLPFFARLSPRGEGWRARRISAQKGPKVRASRGRKIRRERGGRGTQSASSFLRPLVQSLRALSGAGFANLFNSLLG